MSHLCHNLQSLDPDVVRVVQLTDTHLGEKEGATLLGMDTDHSLQAVINQVQQERPHLDLLLGTGDLSDKGARQSYQRLQDHFSRLECDSFWLPGNHDDRGEMAAVASTPARLCQEIRAANWQILLLDSQVPGQVGGELGTAQLELLDRSLQAAADARLHTLICLHHQPVKIGSGWLDEQMVDDAQAFFEVLERYSSVHGVLWGHIHQEIDQMRGQVRLMASPSTCVQFAPGYANFKADDLPPGYRWLDLHADGRIDTGVSRVRDVAFHVELDTRGYL